MGSAGRRVRERGWSVIGGAGHIQGDYPDH